MTTKPWDGNRRFGQVYDILRETRTYQELIKDGLEQGLQQGLQQAQQAQKERLQEMRETLLDVIMELFPKIRIPAQEQVDAIADTALLRQLIVKIHAFLLSLPAAPMWDAHQFAAIHDYYTL